MFTFHTIDLIKQKNPLVHNITNIVAAGDSADGLLAIGASPIMASAKEEVAELATNADVLVINIGTLDSTLVTAMKLAGQAANKAGKPVILDPVGIGASSYRKQVINDLLATIQFTAIRGNAGEMATIAEACWHAKGVDAGSGTESATTIAKIVAQKYQTIAILTGAVDIISNGSRWAEITNGSPLLTQITGSGCLLTAVCGAFIAARTGAATFLSCIEACTSYAVAAELAEKSLSKPCPGSFRVAFMDALANLSSDNVQKDAHIREGWYEK